MELLGDDDLIARFGGGITCAFDVLYRRPSQVWSRIAARLRDPDLAQDAAQEVFARVLVGLPAYEPRGRFRQWLRRMTRHVCIDVTRRPALRAEIRLLDVDDSVIDVAAEDAVAAVSIRESTPAAGGAWLPHAEVEREIVPSSQVTLSERREVSAPSESLPRHAVEAAESARGSSEADRRDPAAASAAAAPATTPTRTRPDSPPAPPAPCPVAASLGRPVTCREPEDDGTG